MTISAEQCRAARGLLYWSQGDIASKAGVGRTTIARFELGTQSPNPASMMSIRRAFEDADIVFLHPNGGGQGVRFKAS